MKTLCSFSQLPDPVQVQPTEVLPSRVSNKATNRIAKTISGLFRGKRELVCGGDIKWKPVDLAAARLLMKSPAINKPAKNPPMKPNSVKPSELTKMHQFLPKGKSQAEFDEAVHHEICAALPNRAQAMTDQLVQVANNAASAKELLESVVTNLRGDIQEFSDSLPAALKAVRAWRMAITNERDLSLAALADIRKFFLSGDHEKEMSRLENFVRTCERLRSLAQDGTLEKVADVMLKLA